MMFPFGETIVVYRDVTGTDAYGDESPVGTTTTNTITQVGVFVSSSILTFEPGRSETVTTATVFAPADADIRSGDRFYYSGRWWVATSHAMPRRNPFTGWEAGSEAVFRLVEG